MKFDNDNLPFKLYNSAFSLKSSPIALESYYNSGRLTQLEYRWRLFFWSWSAYRISGKAGELQHRCYKAFGKNGLDRRIESVANLRKKYILKHYGQYLLDWEE